MDGNKPMSVPLRRFWFSLALLMIIVAAGIVGFKLLVPANSWIDAVYMTVITVTTVGYGLVHPLGQAGEVFAIFLILAGASSMTMVVTLAAGVVLEDVFTPEKERRKMEKRILGLKNHTIICGFGRMGSAVAEIFHREGSPFVIIENEQEALETMHERGYLFVKADATSDEALEAAGVARARSLISVLRSDADNLFVTLSARQLSPALAIIARAQDESGGHKLKRAGATHVVTPYLAGAHRLASAALRPAFVDFIETLSSGSSELGFQFEELPVSGKSAAAGKTLASLNLGQQYGVIIVAIMREHGKLVFNPGGKTELHPGDTLIAIGTIEQFHKMREMLSGND